MGVLFAKFIILRVKKDYSLKIIFFFKFVWPHCTLMGQISITLRDFGSRLVSVECLVLLLRKHSGALCFGHQELSVVFGVPALCQRLLLPLNLSKWGSPSVPTGFFRWLLLTNKRNQC